MAAQSVDAIIQAKKLERDFSKVVLTLENVILPDEMLHPTPSMLDNLTYEQECDLRIYGCELIQTSGELLNLPQVAMATGQVVFQRFFYRKSFVKHNVEIVAMASIALSSKLEEAPRKIRDVINVFNHIKQVKHMKIITPMMLDSNYVNLKNQVIKAERRILKELGFCVHVKHPHKMIFIYLQLIECERNKRLVQTAWNYMNDSFRTDVFVRYAPETIACACIYLAARKLQICLPNNPPWWVLMETNETDLQRISKTILSLYSRKKTNIDELEAVVNNLRKEQNDARLKAKEARLLVDDMGTRNGSAEESNHPSPAVPAASAKKEIFEERPTQTLGEELNRLRGKERQSESEPHKSGLDDEKTSRKTSNSKEKLSSHNSYKLDRFHDLKHSEKSYPDSETRRDRHRKDYKYSSSKLDDNRPDELVKKRSNGTDRLTSSLDGSDKYSSHHHHREKAKKRKRDRSPSPTSYKASRQSRDYKYKYSNSRSPSPILYKESKHSRDIHKYKHSSSKHESRH